MESVVSFAVSVAVESLSKILIEEAAALRGVASRVEWIERELRVMQAFLEHVERRPRGQEQEEEGFDEWAEELKDVARDADDAVQTFVLKFTQRNWILSLWDRHMLSKELDVITKRMTDISKKEVDTLPEATVAQTFLKRLFLSAYARFRENTKHPKIQTRGSLRRGLNYGTGEEGGVGDRKSFIFFSLFFTPTLVTVSPSVVKVSSSQKTSTLSTVIEWTSLEMKWVSIVEELPRMRALLRDAEGLNLNERQKVWLEQMKVVAQRAGALVAAYEHRVNKYKQEGVFRRLLLHSFPILEFEEELQDMKLRMRNIWERKTIYCIANIEGRTDLVSLGQSTQQHEPSECEIDIVVERNHDSGTEEDPHLPAKYQPVKGHGKKGVESIREEMQLMNALFKDAEVMGELDARSKIWVDEMRLIALETEAVSNEYARKWEGKTIYAHIRNYTQFQLPYFLNKIDEIRNKIQDASRRRETYGLDDLQTRAESSSSVIQRLRRTMQPPRTGKGSSIFGFEEDVQVLMAQLLSAEKRRCITSIVGIGGTGKTTLARLIYDNDAIQQHFDDRIWASITPTCTVELLLEDIAAKVVRDQQNRSTPTEVLKSLANRRYLIVVDGIETSEVLDTLKSTIPDMSTGCRLFLTSRKANVDIHEGPRTFVHQLQLLDDKNSWLLFRRNLKVDIPPELMKVGKEIVIKCGGLPSEILKAGELLSQKYATNEEWSRVLEQLNQDKTPWLETLNAIKMNLPLYLRRCLSSFSLFPAEFKIPARRLVVLWVAEDLVHHGEDEETPEQVAERYLTELIYMNIVQIAKRKHNGKVKTCRLPNALRESTKVNQPPFLQGNPVPKKFIIRHVVDHLDKNDICHNHIHSDTRSTSASLRSFYKEVHSFLSFDTQEGSKPGQEIGAFLDRCITGRCFLLLRVLDLERVYKPQLPENISRLSRLRYLGLRWTYMESLPSSISSLLKLQTLDLKHTYISILTSSIWKMQLRHLFLSETYRSRFPPQQRHNSLSNLQTLWGLFVDEETPVRGGLDTLVNIRKLGLACQSMSLDHGKMKSQLRAIADWIMNLKHLQSLRLKSRDEKGQPWNLPMMSLENNTFLTDMYLLGILPSLASLFPPSLVELTLSHSELTENQDPMKILGALPNLRSLCLLAGSYIGKTLFCNDGSFPQLYVLKFWKLENLEEWIIEKEALPHLRQLEIRSCTRLKTLPDGLRQVNTLLDLTLRNMPMDDNEARSKIPSNCELNPDNPTK